MKTLNLVDIDKSDIKCPNCNKGSAYKCNCTKKKLKCNCNELFTMQFYCGLVLGVGFIIILLKLFPLS